MILWHEVPQKLPGAKARSKEKEAWNHQVDES